ncbi:MAG: DUF7144 family membrane protein [Actinomycetota bacterium]
MDPPLPPPPPRPDMGWQTAERVPAPRSARPQLVTAAAVILIALGALQALAGMVFLFVSPQQLADFASMENVSIEPLARGIGFFILVVGSLGVLAGILVLRLSGGGRVFAIVLASIGLMGGIGNVSHGYAPGLVTLGLYVFVIYVLFAHASAFRGTRRG